MKKSPMLEQIHVELMQRQILKLRIIGITPYVYHALSERSSEELLVPKMKSKKRVDREKKPRHQILEEYVESTYRDARRTDTYLYLPGRHPKAAMVEAAYISPGTASKASVRKAVWIKADNHVDHLKMYGTPMMFLAPVKNSGISQTTDIRTRAILPEWCADLTVEYYDSLISKQAVINLLSNAGDVMGCGDWRPQKSGGAFGRFRIVEDSSEEAYARIQSTGGYQAQYDALHAEMPSAYDDFSDRMIVKWMEAHGYSTDRITSAA